MTLQNTAPDRLEAIAMVFQKLYADVDVSNLDKVISIFCHFHNLGPINEYIFCNVHSVAWSAGANSGRLKPRPPESVRRNGKQQFVCTKGPVC